MTNEPLIAVESITKRFPGVTALDDVSLEIRAGELHAVVGENGAGKSTLMKILAGVITDYEGTLRIAGRPVAFQGPRDAEQAGVAIIHQELNLVEELTVAANIFLGRERTSGWGWLQDREMERLAQAEFERLECPIDPRRRVADLRVGDRQLVEIAKALSLEASILIMDEPTSALTETEVDRLFQVIERLLAAGTTILYISHKMDEVFRRSDRITVLRDGRVVTTLAREATNPRQVAHLMVGREIEEVHLGEGRAAGDVVLEVRNLSLPWHGHARQWRLHNVSFALHRGEIVGLAGLMGAGRTELLECLFGASPEPPQGEIRLMGRPVRFEHPADAVAAGVALVTEDRKRYGIVHTMSVRENLTLSTLRRALRAGLVSSRLERQLADELIRTVNVRAAHREVPITTLSGGNQQKCIIARWLATDPKVLLLDDPTRGVDVGAKAELYRLIDRLCRQGLGILVTSSELPELITLCDRILVLAEGRLVAELPRGEFSEEAIMEAATRSGPESKSAADVRLPN